MLKNTSLSREDMSLVLHEMKQLLALVLNQGTENTKVVKLPNFVPVNKCYIKVVLFPDSCLQIVVLWLFSLYPWLHIHSSKKALKPVQVWLQEFHNLGVGNKHYANCIPCIIKKNLWNKFRVLNFCYTFTMGANILKFHGYCRNTYKFV